MTKINYKLWKKSFPYICECCGKPHGIKREFCESCGCKNALRGVIKKDYKIRRLL